MRLNEFGYKSKMESIIVEMRRRMRETLEEKITFIMANYEQQFTWLPDNACEQPSQIIEWTLEYIKSAIYELRRTNNPASEEMAYSWIGYIAQLYWEYFEQCKEFNLLTIYNLEKDLIFVYKYLMKYFPFYSDLFDKFKGLSQFYEFMLTNNVQDILDKQKRDITYSHLDIPRLIPILRKYNKAKNNAGGKIRELKKKDIENVVKRLEMDKWAAILSVCCGTA